jgi:hypothetical protein
VERQPFDFVDDSARNRQLVLCPVLRFLQIVAILPLTEGRTRPSQKWTRCSTRRAMCSGIGKKRKSTGRCHFQL